MAGAHSHLIPEDDLSAVLGRFRAWNLTPEEKGAVSPEHPDASEGLQELSYEEALQARVRRVAVREPLGANELTRARLRAETGGKGAGVSSQAAAAPKPAAHSLVAPKAAREATDAVRSATAKSPAAASSQAAVPSRQDTRAAAPGRKVVAPKSRAAVRAAPSASRPAPAVRAKATVSRPAERSARPAPSHASGTRKPSARPAAKQTGYEYFRGKGMSQRMATAYAADSPHQSFESILHDSLERGPERGLERGPERGFERSLEPRLDYGRGKSSRAAGAGSRTRAPRTGSLARSLEDDHSDAKSIAMKLRVSPQEHAKIKAGAAEAGVTLAAYMRQCTLDVKILRGLLTQTIAELQALPKPAAAVRAEAHPARRAAATLSEPEEDGLLTRLVAAFFGQKSKARKRSGRLRSALTSDTREH